MTFQITAKTTGGFTRTITPVIREQGRTVTLTVPREKLCNPRLESLIVESSLTTAKADGRGSMFYPTNFYYGFALTRFTEREDVLFKTWPTATLVCGFGCDTEYAVFMRVAGEAFDGRFYVSCKDNVYSVSPQFRFDGDEPDEDVVI
ncbi:MAG: hypothetical protein II771_00710, partial [Clostridia bacterium]|nr:hypothetical protein [Clostridia bacterium]